MQAECTSCGLNQGPLCAEGRYSAAIAANLYNWPDTSASIDCKRKKGVYLDEERVQGIRISIIKRFSSSARAVYKYFLLEGETCIRICIRGNAKGIFTVLTSDGKTDIPIEIRGKDWSYISGTIAHHGKSFLEFRYSGTGMFDIRDFEFVILKP